LYNLWKRTVGPKSSELTFKLTTEETLFQQRWRSKAAVRAYHGDFIPEKIFKRWYLPDNIPDVRPRRAVFSGGDKIELEEYARRKLRARQQEKEHEEEIEQKGMAPVGSLMFVEVERRLDVFLFRCCFVHSVYEARRLIIHGYVKLNGVKVRFVLFLAMGRSCTHHFFLTAREGLHSVSTW
jgi:ribosomal protein S4